ncbi:pseudaminic acid synthase [Gallaecimonas kandeliae]|uniref:pseudaminic acid synthase n=1 Tax=Gallaecimonas kandeliae TaxID=3029055 RepID=UPI002649E2D0|nr:pseudaminic acid synthase [Gallaecimonas kandeliae]WKE66728.1 pseudaminic acid synthase [Gallaecimonas kandeliae]
MTSTFRIWDHLIGPGQPPFVIAELSCNHSGSLDKALAHIDAAADAGVQAIKLQTYTADTMTLDLDLPDFRIQGGLWDGYSLYELYEKAYTPWDWHSALFARARQHGLVIFSSPFDETAVDFLESLDVPAYKVASFEATDLPLVAKMASTGKPLIISTGMSNFEEIAETLACARDNGARDIALLHCISSYPTPLKDANLKRMQALAERFKVVVGLSDHSLGTLAASAAVALGASIVEKHFILSRDDDSPDAAFSLEPAELAQLARDCRDTWEALGSGEDKRSEGEKANLRFRRSLYFVADLPAGTEIRPEHLRRIRPGFGLAPKHQDAVIGRRTRQAVTAGTAVAWELLD